MYVHGNPIRYSDPSGRHLEQDSGSQKKNDKKEKKEKAQQAPKTEKKEVKQDIENKIKKSKTITGTHKFSFDEIEKVIENPKVQKKIKEYWKKTVQPQKTYVKIKVGKTSCTSISKVTVPDVHNFREHGGYVYANVSNIKDIKIVDETPGPPGGGTMQMNNNELTFSEDGNTYQKVTSIHTHPHHPDMPSGEKQNKLVDWDSISFSSRNKHGDSMTIVTGDRINVFGRGGETRVYYR
ncbi:MAG: hypothetical protein MJE63_17530 [Proteobacteria bacterium]|nr:hypothetical protein [Pseudomonadota bacterium]